MRVLVRVAHRVAVMGANISVAALKAAGQDIGECELVFDLIDSFHVSNDLERLEVDQAVGKGWLAPVWRSRHLLCQAGVDP